MDKREGLQQALPCCKPFPVCRVCTLGRTGVVPGFGELRDHGLYKRTGLLHVPVADAQNRRRGRSRQRLGSDRPRGREDRGTGAGLSPGGDCLPGHRHGGGRLVSCKDRLRDREKERGRENSRRRDSPFRGRDLRSFPNREPLCGSGQCDLVGRRCPEPIRREERVRLFPEHPDGGLRDSVLSLLSAVPVPISFRERAAVSGSGCRDDGPVHLASQAARDYHGDFRWSGPDGRRYEAAICRESGREGRSGGRKGGRGNRIRAEEPGEAHRREAARPGSAGSGRCWGPCFPHRSRLQPDLPRRLVLPHRKRGQD